MKPFRVPAGIAVILAAAFLAAGVKAEAGYLLGVGASVFNLAGLWFGIKLFANAATSAKPDPRNVFFIALMCFLKMPTFIAAGFLAWKVGAPAPAYYLIGVGLVYSVMIWWAFRAR